MMIKRVREIFDYDDMIVSLVGRDLRGKYKGSVLGFLWTFINPLCQIIVYTVVFSQIMRSGIEQFYVYMITGIIPWFAFSSGVAVAAGCIRGQGDMVKKIYFPREVLPLVSVTFQFVNMLFCFIIVFAVIAFSGRGFNLVALSYLPLVIILEYMITLGISLIVSAITVYFRDMEHIIGVILMAWIYCTPIMYTIDIVPEYLIFIFQGNPMTHIVEMYHSILYYGTTPEPVNFFVSLLWGIGLLFIGELVFMKLEDNFAEEL